MKRLVSFALPALRVFWAIVLGLAAVGVLLVAAHVPLASTYATLTTGAFGSALAWQQTSVYALDIGLTSLAAIVAFRAGIWNIGADGQLIMGSIAGTVVGLAIGPALPPAVALPVVVLAAMAAGAVWALVPALLRAYLDVNEVITTLMLNYVAGLFLRYLLYGPMHDPSMQGFPYSRTLPASTWLPSLGTGFNLGIVFWLAVAAAVAVFLAYTTWGYELKLTRGSVPTARYAGLHVRRNVVVVMLVSGAIAGLAGLGDVLGSAHQLFVIDTQSYGYIGILVAWLVALNPLASVVVAVLYGGLIAGGDALKMTGTSPSIVIIIQAVLVMAFLAGGSLFRLRRGRVS